MDFIRKINKNVQESFSILNEGIQITNSILELNTIHLPQLFQLCPSKNKNGKEGGLCCLFEENKPEIVGSVEQVKTNGLKSKEVGEQTNRSKFLNRLRTGYQEKYDLNKNQVTEPGKNLELECAQGEKCLLKSFSVNLYVESIDFVSFFLNTLSNVLKDSNKASRKLVENQTFLVLFEISKLVEVTVFLRSDNQKVRKIIQDVDSICGSLINLVSFSLKLLNEVLQYPLHIFYNNLEKEYDDCRIEKRKYESFLKQRYPSQNLDEYDMIGSFWFINITDEEKIDLDQYLLYLDSILDSSNNSRSIINYISLICEQEDDSYKNILYGFLLIFQKLFGYNDLNWHLSENDTNKLYFWSRYYDSCSYYLYYNDCCYDCTKPKMNPNLSVEGDYCTCLLSNERCNFRVKIVLEEDLKTNKEVVRILSKVLEHFSEVYIKTRVLGLILQIVSQIDPFMDLMHKHGIFESVFETLSECSNDQFYLLNNTLNVVTYQSQNPINFLSLIREEDLKILMTFPPCTIESILLIHKYVVASKLKIPVKYRKILLNYSKSLTLLYTYYKCTYQSSKTLELSGLFSQILTVVIESVLVAQVAQRNLTEVCYPFCLHLVSKLGTLEYCSDFCEFRDNFDLELFNMLACSYVVLLNLSKSGTFVEYHLFSSISNYLSVSLCFTDKFGSDNVVEWMTTQTVNNLHEVYKYMLNVAHTKETNNEEVVRIKMDSLLDFGTFPIFQLAVTLFDPYINTRICDKLIKSVSSMKK
uniref:Uncharacterized protein n=1 Tax=Theileria annulata TaxID=5874 RepID=A0A3B0MMY1_THEAN